MVVVVVSFASEDIFAVLKNLNFGATVWYNDVDAYRRV